MTAAPRGWNRPVKPGALIVVSVIVLLVWLAVVGSAVWYFYETWEARFTLRDQPVQLRLPTGMKASADVASPIRTRIDLRPRLVLDLDQTMPVRITDSLIAHATLNTILPIDTSVQVDTVVPVSTTLDLSVSIKSWLPRVQVSVPLTLNLPVRMTVPIRTEVPISLDIDASGELPPALDVPVRATFVLHPEIRADIDVRMDATTLFSLTGPMAPFDVRIARADVRLPFHLGLRHRPLP
jgi:hypothetical protein